MLSSIGWESWQHQALITLGLSAAVPALRWLLHVYLFEPVGHTLLQATAAAAPGGQAADSKAALLGNDANLKLEKLCESFWKLLVYSALLALGVSSLVGQSWVLDTQLLWTGWPNHPVTLPMLLVYNLELGFYISSVFMIVFWEVRRKDFPVMFTHHLVTVVLIAASMHFKFWRVGCLVMVLHDATDVLMEAAKICSYLQWEDASTGIFVAFIVAWAVLRLTCFPLMVVRSTLLESRAIVGEVYTPGLYRLFNALLLTLAVIHCYWFTLILRIAWIKVTTGDAMDVREDD